MARTLLAMVLAWLVASSAALAEGRVALVIGNGDYESVGALANPVNDATDLASALERIGFDVTLATDLGGSAMRASLKQFRDKAEGAEMALVYFAGHGIEIAKENYVIPVDADLKTDSDVLFDTIPLDMITEAVSGATALRMVLLDACRNNPFLGQIRVADSSRSIGRGLSPFEPSGGTLVAFAAKGGTVALDGNGRNSPFMKGLLAHIEEPGLDINLMFRKVRDSVLEATANRQEPFTYGSLPGREIYLVPPTEVAAVTPEPVAAPPPVAAPVVGTPEEEFAWSLLGESTDPVQIQKFIRTFPAGVHVDEAFARLDQLRQIAPATPVTPEPAEEVAVAPAPLTPAPAAVAPPAADLEVAALPDEPRATSPLEPEPEPVVDLKPLIVSLQKELRRAGCNPGPADGIWGPRSIRAVTAFGRDGDITIASTTPSEELLTTIKSLSGTVCVQVAAAPPTRTKKRTTTPAPTTTAATPPPAAVAEPEPQAAVVVENENEDDFFGTSSDDDCGMGVLFMGPLGMAACD